MTRMMTDQSDAISIVANIASVERAEDPRWNTTTAASQEVTPAITVEGSRGLVPRWLQDVIQSINELAVEPRGWDSYDADPLHPRTVVTLLQVLTKYAAFIRTAPVLSLTESGGLDCLWENSEAALDVVAYSNGRLTAYYLDKRTDEEWDGDLADCPNLEKRTWKASAIA